LRLLLFEKPPYPYGILGSFQLWSFALRMSKEFKEELSIMKKGNGRRYIEKNYKQLKNF